MYETSVYEYYAFGYNYFILRQGTVGHTVKGDGDSLEWFLNEVLERLDSLNLQVTSEAASKLKEISGRVDSMPDDATVDEALGREVTEACNQIDVTLDAELKLRRAFVVTPQRYSAHHLLEEPWDLFGAGTWERLPDIAVFDFIEACRAVAFGLATASAFHLMRCVEAMLREYYCTIVKRNRVKLWWGPMVQHLRQRRDAPPRAILDHMDNIRVNFRNPTQHPDARYESEEAQDLLALSIDAVNRMARDLAARGN